jgi:PAS domain S-box-containing protein
MQDPSETEPQIPAASPEVSLLQPEPSKIAAHQPDAADLIQVNGILRAVVNGTEDVIFVKDLQGRYVLINTMGAQWLGTSVEAVIGQDDRALFPLEKALEIEAIDRQVLLSGELISYEEQTPKRDGWRSLLTAKYPWRDATGNIVGMIGICRDISDKRDAELERERLLVREQEARQQAEKANRIKDEFLAVLSHELRSPLNPILGWVKLLRKGKLDELKTQEALASIERNATLQSQIIEDLLDISRILQGKLILNLAPVNLSTLIGSAMETIRPAAEAKNIQIQTCFEAGVNPVLGDAGRLQQIISNLLSNAVKFTPAGGWVEVRLSQIDRQAQIQVLDNGKGIDASFLPHVFDHFRQEDGATTRKFGGLGLGLAIVRQLVELHDGTVRAESPGEDRGAIFTVQLPIVQQGVESIANVSSPVPLDDTSPLTGLKICVVDDETDSRDFVTFVLQLAGAEITALSSGSEALQWIEEARPDLLVSDIGMPDMDGYELIDRIRHQLPLQLPAIALTAYAGEANEQKVLQAGFQKHLAKPIDPIELVAAVAQLRSD